MSKKIDKYNEQRELLKKIGFKVNEEKSHGDGIVCEISDNIHNAPIVFRADVHKSGKVEYIVCMYDINDLDKKRLAYIKTHTFPLETPAAKALKDSLKELNNEVVTTLETKISGASEVKTNTSDRIQKSGIIQINLTSEKPADLVYKELRKYIETKGKE